MSMTNVVLTVGQQAAALLDDPHFQAQWKSLHDQCAHATAFQSPRFVRAWYCAYREKWHPIIVHALQEDGKLAGLWLLAQDTKSRQLVHAGGHQAEYHAWLVLPGRDRSFLAAAWAALKRRVAFSALRVKYLPSAGMASQLEGVPGMRNCVVVRRHARPLLRLTQDEIKASFAKKSNKSRFNRLKKLGQIEFRRVVDTAELATVFNDLIAYYDLRQGAANQSTPFHDDDRKEPFHRDVFSQSPAETYVTVTYLDKRPIAAFWGESSGNTVHLGLLLYSPFVAEHSPGKLHLMQLSEYLLGNGKDVLDLTPGGDAWKERFANAHDEVEEAIIYRSPAGQLHQSAIEAVMRLCKRGASVAGVSPERLRSAAALIRRARPNAVSRKLMNWFDDKREFRVYRCERSLVERFSRDERVHCNAIPDLLLFKPGESWQSRDGFLSAALMRLEQGESAFTVTIGDRLAHSGWMVKQTESTMTEVKQTMQFPPGSVALYDFYSHPDFRGRGLYRAAIAHMLCEAFSDETVQFAYISVLADNLPSRHVIETIGFEYQTSFFWERRFGTERTWAGHPVSEAEALCA